MPKYSAICNSVLATIIGWTGPVTRAQEPSARQPVTGAVEELVPGASTGPGNSAPLMDDNSLPFVHGHAAAVPHARSYGPSGWGGNQFIHESPGYPSHPYANFVSPTHSEYGHPHGFKAWCARHKAKLQAKYWGYPEEFCETPFGALVNAHCCTQIRNGLMAQTVLYQYDFYGPEEDLAAQLKPRGKIQLQKIVRILECQYFPIAVEATGDDKLDEARRQTVFHELANLGYPVTEEQIFTTRISVDGLEGAEAFDIYSNLLDQTRAGGVGGSGQTGTSTQALLISPTTTGSGQ